MLVARLVCSDERCAAEIAAEARTLRELETLSCDCGCALEIIAWPDHEDDQVATLIALPARGRLSEAA